MTEKSTESMSERYFCTAGNGMESFLMEEAKRKLAAQNVVQFQGKVIFSSSASITSIIDLKSAERLFLLLKHDSPLKLNTHINRAKAASLLQSKLLVQSELTRAAMTWSRLQRELKDRATLQSSGAGDKRKRDSSESSVLTEKCDGDDSNSRFIHEQDGGLENHSKRRRQDFELEDPYDPEHISRLLPQDQISFRISCKCSGSLARFFSTQDVSKILGTGLTSSLGWRVDLKNPLLEVNVNLTDDYCLLGIPLTRSPLANRNYLKTTGLRSTVAWALASLAQIQPGSLVVDPMCGVGTVLIEAAQEHKDTYFLGMDINDEQLFKAKGNVVYAHLESRMQVLKASCLDLPLHTASVDAVVCDLPFGRKFGNKEDAATNLPLVLSEMARVIRVGGALVLLLSPQLSVLVKKLLAQESSKPDPPLEKKLQTEKQDVPPAAASSEQLLSQSCNNTTVSEPERLSGQHCTSALLHLRLEQSFRVSLGAIDGLIHKYVKSDLC